jgi:SAM-dependent methyltransferase
MDGAPAPVTPPRGDAHTPRLARRTAAAQAAFFLPYLRPGMRVLDVGCGPGTITLGLAEAVAPGEVVGVDVREDRLALARAAATERQVPNARFERGDVYALPFPDAAFDAALVHAVLEHLPDPGRALAAVRRVLRPGGVVGVRGPDHAAALIGPAAPWVDEWRRFFLRAGERRGGSFRLGPELRGVVRAAGFGRVVASATVEVYGTPDETRVFAADVLRLLAEGFYDDPARPEPAAFSRAWVAWCEHPDAFYAATWCEAVGWAD